MRDVAAKPVGPRRQVKGTLGPFCEHAEAGQRAQHPVGLFLVRAGEPGEIRVLHEGPRRDDRRAAAARPRQSSADTRKAPIIFCMSARAAFSNLTSMSAVPRMVSGRRESSV